MCWDLVLALVIICWDLVIDSGYYCVLDCVGILCFVLVIVCWDLVFGSGYSVMGFSVWFGLFCVGI